MPKYDIIFESKEYVHGVVPRANDCENHLHNLQ
jgi:hypothetical protein